MATAAALGWASLIVSAGVAYKSSEDQAVDLKKKSKAEEANAKTREIERKRELVRALAAGNVGEGASGTTGGFGSSNLALMMSDIRKEGLDESVDVGATNQRITQLKSNADAVQDYAVLSAAGTIAGGAKRYKKRGSVD